MRHPCVLPAMRIQAYAGRVIAPRVVALRHRRGRADLTSVAGYLPPVQRSLVVGDVLFTVSAAGVEANDLATFAERGFAAFDAG